MKHSNITEHIESFSKEIVILLYIYWYLSLSKNALYIILDKETHYSTTMKLERVEFVLRFVNHKFLPTS